MTALKQPGRRYGPAPKPAPKHRGAPTPMDLAARVGSYMKGRPGARHCTERQIAQTWRMAELHDESSRYGGKGSATPKQRKVRR